MIAALLDVLAQAAATGALRDLTPVTSTELARQLDAVAAGLVVGLPAALMARAVGAFGELVGLVTLELGGHFVGGFEPADDLYEACVVELADRLGLPS